MRQQVHIPNDMYEICMKIAKEEGGTTWRRVLRNFVNWGLYESGWQFRPHIRPYNYFSKPEE